MSPPIKVWGVGCGVWGVGCGVWGVEMDHFAPEATTTVAAAGSAAKPLLGVNSVKTESSGGFDQ